MFEGSKLGGDSVSVEVCYVCGLDKQQVVVCCLRVVKANNSFKLVASILVGVLAEGKQYYAGHPVKRVSYINISTQGVLGLNPRMISDKINQFRKLSKKKQKLSISTRQRW